MVSFREAVKLLEGKSGIVIIPRAEMSASSEVTMQRPSFAHQWALYEGDPDVSSSVDFITDIATGSSFETVADNNYKEKGEGLDGERKGAKEIVDEQIEEFGLENLTSDFVRHIIGVGNAFIYRGNPEKIETLQLIPPSGISHVNFDNFKLKTVTLADNTILSADELTWLSYNHVDAYTPLGVGVCRTLLMPLQTPEGIRPAFATIKAEIQKAFKEQITMFSAPNQMWNFPGLPDKKLPELNSRIQQMKRGTRVVTNVGGGVINAIPERMRGLEFYADKLWDSFYLGLGTPYPKLILGGGFTEASANVAQVVGERRIASLQRYLSWVLKHEFFDKWISAAGLNPRKAKVSAQWRLIRRPDPNVLLPVILDAAKIGALSREEFREVLIDLGLPLQREISGTLLTPPKESAAPGITGNRPDQPMESAAKKYEETPQGGDTGR